MIKNVKKNLVSIPYTFVMQSGFWIKNDRVTIKINTINVTMKNNL